MPFSENPCRYVRSLTPNQNLVLGPYSLPQPPFIQYESGFPQLGQLARAQIPMNYSPSSTIMNPFCAVGSNQTSSDAVYFQWPSPAMMYAHSYDHFRHTIAQVCTLFLCYISEEIYNAQLFLCISYQFCQEKGI